MFDGELSAKAVFDFDVASAAIKGSRDYQEDSILTSFALGAGYGFAIVADGIGGHASGHVASALVTTEIFNHLKMQEQYLETGKINVPFVLEQAAKASQQKIAEHVKGHAETKGMGTTLLVPVVRGDRLSWISVGDSLLFLLRDGALRQLNKDHSMAPQIDMMVKTGSMSAEVGKDHPDRNTLTSVINADKIEKIDCPSAAVQLKDGDVLIAASDGLQSLPTEALVKTLIDGAAESSTELVKTLLKQIEELNAPDQDNTSFVVIQAKAKVIESGLMDLDAMPILGQADGAAAQPVAPVSIPAPDPAQDREKKAYWYRGQKYYRD